MTHLYADTDSHTSIILSKVIWQEQYGRSIHIIPLKGPLPKDAQAVMLIGDKVVQADLPQMEFDADLGLAWKTLTGLPFVFAAWAARAEAKLADLPAILETARDRGVDQAARIAQIQGPNLGWPTGLALEYLSDCLRFTLNDRMREGMNVFFDLARKHGFLSFDRELVFA
jgi:chorismate dehydratase